MSAKKERDEKLLKQIIFSNLLLFSGVLLMRMDKNSEFHSAFKRLGKSTIASLFMYYADFETDRLYKEIVELKIKKLDKIILFINDNTLQIIESIFSKIYNDNNSLYSNYVTLKEIVTI